MTIIPDCNDSKIPYLRFCIHRYLLSCNIIVAAIDIDICGLEIIVERKSLVELVGGVEEHILWNTAIVGIEVEFGSLYCVCIYCTNLCVFVYYYILLYIIYDKLVTSYVLELRKARKTLKYS